MSTVLGIDIGGTGIKAAPVDTASGICAGPRTRVATPQPATPPTLVAAIRRVIHELNWSGPIGVGFPGVIKDGIVTTAANLDQTMIGADLQALLSHDLGTPQVGAVNDADAAGLAEVAYGAAKGQPGVVVMITLGTGIGTAVLSNGRLVPNSELGHILINGIEAEQTASGRAKVDDGMTWKQWSGHLLDFIKEIERLLWPDLFVIGGGISAEFRSFCEHIRSRTPSVAAQLGNDAGIIGAALSVEQDASRR